MDVEITQSSNILPSDKNYTIPQQCTRYPDNPVLNLELKSFYWEEDANKSKYGIHGECRKIAMYLQGSCCPLLSCQVSPPRPSGRDDRDGGGPFSKAASAQAVSEQSEHEHARQTWRDWWEQHLESPATTLPIEWLHLWLSDTCLNN